MVKYVTLCFQQCACYGASYIILVLPVKLVLQKGILISHLRHDMKNMTAGHEEWSGTFLQNVSKDLRCYAVT